jgi:DNA-binding transcriptional ArsR family regulator
VTALLAGAVAHEVRLDLLCCLDGEEPLTVEAVGARIGKSEITVAYHLKPLVTHRVVRRRADQRGPVRYEACLDDHPAWVREAVEAHRRQREN